MSMDVTTGVVREGLGDAVLRVAGAAVFVLLEAEEWQWWFYLLWGALIGGAMSLLGTLLMLGGEAFYGRTIPVRGKHLDALGPLDTAFIVFNKLITPVYVYVLTRFAWSQRGVLFDFSALPSLGGLLLALAVQPLFFALFDIPYTAMHRALHHRSIYWLIHKHHHKQKAPSRGQLDAINVHPVEYVLGEFNHIPALWAGASIVAPFTGPINASAVLIFQTVAGIFAMLNHTRYDVNILGCYKVKFHDVHHWYPKANFGQYTIMWDYLTGSFRSHPDDVPFSVQREKAAAAAAKKGKAS